MNLKELYLKEMRLSGYNTTNIPEFHKFAIPYLLNKYSIKHDDLIVDIGAAEGHCIYTAKNSNYKNLAVVDYVDENFNKFNSDDITTYNCDITNSKLPFENDSVSAFFLFHVVEHIHDSNLIISECYRTLKKKGVLFIATPNWARQIKTFHEDPTHIRPFIKSGLSRLLRIHGWKDFQVFSFGTSFGLSKLKLYKIFPKLAFIGRDILAICIKD